ncbi:MAG: hypothetical protein DSY86_10175, partial [Marinomonas sp.]
VKNVYIQLYAEGIYYLGLENLLQYIDELFRSYGLEVSEYYVSIADINAFVNYDFSDIKADATYLMFGFFSCSDICPIRVHQLQQLSQQLDQSNAAQDVRFLMVTIDPNNEPSELRARYFSQLSDRFISAELSPKALNEVQHTLGERVRSFADGPTHAGNLYLFDQNKELVKIYSQLSYPKGALYSDLTSTLLSDKGSL